MVEPVRRTPAGELSEVRTLADLARLLRELRRRHARQRNGAALTYRELATATGWSHGIIGEYLSGRILPPTDRFDVLVRLLGATPAEQGALATARDQVEEHRRRAEPGPARTPRQLPIDVYGFTGREEPLRELTALLDPRTSRICVLSGTAGVGKTALAVHWAHRVAEHFPDGQLYLDLRGYDPGPAVTPADALAVLLRALGVDSAEIPSDVSERAASYRTALAGRHVLVLLDNAHSAAQVRPLLPGTGTCAIVVTSRDDLAGLVAREGARRVDVDLLTAAEAVSLLTTLIGPGVAADPATATALAERCARLPLALRIAAEFAVAHPATTLAGLVSDLHDQQRRLDLLDAAGDPRTAVRSVFSWSYQHLSDAGARTFGLLGLHPGRDIELYAVAALAGADLPRARSLVDELARAHLIESVDSPTYASDVHNAVSVVAVRNGHSKDALKVADVVAALDAGNEGSRGHCLLDADGGPPNGESAANAGTAEDSGPLLRTDRAVGAVETDDSFDGHRRGDTNGSNRTATSVLSGSIVGRTIARPLTGVVESTGERYVMHDLLRAYAVERAAEAGADHARAALGRLFDYYLRTAAVAADTLYPHERGRPEIPPATTPIPPVHERYQASRWLDHQRPTLVAVAAYASRHGWPGHSVDLSRTLWRHLEVGGHYQEALAIHTEAATAALAAHGRAGVLANLGSIHWWLGDHQQAKTCFEQSLAGHQEIDDDEGKALALARLGLVHERLGSYAEALAHLGDALTLYRRIGNRHGQGAQLINLGALHRRIGRYDEAAEHLRQAAEVFVDIGDLRLEGYALGNLGAVYQQVGRYDEALRHLQRALANCRASADPGGEGSALSTLGLTYQKLGRYAEALDHLHRALAISRDTADRSLEAETLNTLGETLHAMGQPGPALARHRTALALTDQTGHRYEHARALEGIADVLDHAVAADAGAAGHRKQAHAIYHALGVPEAERVRQVLDGLSDVE
jgi:tetratricopeptide (TPR) repeat protein